MHDEHAEIKSKFSVKTAVYFWRYFFEITIDLVFSGARLFWTDPKLTF